MDRTWTSKYVILTIIYNEPLISPMTWQPSSHSSPLVTLVTPVSIVPTPRVVSSPTPLRLCLVDIIPRVC